MCSELLRCCSTCTLTLPHRLLCVPCVRASQTVNTAGKIIAWTILRPFDKANELKAGDSTLTLYSPRTKPSIAHMTKKFTLPGAKLVVHIDTDDDEEKEEEPENVETPVPTVVEEVVEADTAADPHFDDNHYPVGASIAKYKAK